jgi:hypothetical protein
LKKITLNALIFSIHRTDKWWRYLGSSLGLDSFNVISEIKGEGDISIASEFYKELRAFKKTKKYNILTRDECQDIISRCRVLRWLDYDLSIAMIHAMANIFERLLDDLKPNLVLSFPIDRYPTDVLARISEAKGIPYLELTAGVFPDSAMLLRRGRLIKSVFTLREEEFLKRKEEIVNPLFTPSYVSFGDQFSYKKFIVTYLYFKLRGLVFKLISILKNDPLNLHYLDSQQFLGHKARWRDIKIINYIDYEWRKRLNTFQKEKIIFFGLQLFPEASIDYWIKNAELIDHENIVVQAAQVFSDAGYLILVKDHPLQFGFRNTGMIKKLIQIQNVVLVPYGVTGNELLSLSGVNFTFTGTLGLQAALAGLKSIVTDCYYSNSDDFIIFRDRKDIEKLPYLVNAKIFKDNLESRRERIVRHLMSGSFCGDIFTFKNFNSSNPPKKIDILSNSLALSLKKIINNAH